ncbi:hypothetical protein HN51_052857 [Arachis hypogaea]
MIAFYMKEGTKSSEGGMGSSNTLNFITQRKKDGEEPAHVTDGGFEVGEDLAEVCSAETMVMTRQRMERLLNLRTKERARSRFLEALAVRWRMERS